MPKQGSLSLNTLVGATIIFGSLIITTFTAVYTWANWLGFPNLEFIGLTRDYSKLLAGIIWGFGLQVFNFLILTTTGWLQILNVNFESQSIINVVIITVSSLYIGIAEEVIYRGVIYSSLRRKWGWIVAAFFTSILFALPHFISISYDFPFIAGLGLFAGGFLFAWTKEVSQTLWVPIGIHFVWDAAIGWFNITASKSSYILVTSFNAPKWIVGEWALNDWIFLLVFALSIWSVKLRQKAG